VLENVYLRQQVIVLSREKKRAALTNQDRRLLVSLDIQVSKRTIQKYLKRMPRLRPSGQTRSTFVRNHAADIWACDFVQTYDVFFRTIFVFVIIELESRQVVHGHVTRSSSDAWVAQQLRETTPFGEHPVYLIRDNDRKFGEHFANVATEIEVLRTPVHAPRANVYCERFIGSLRRECLDHVLILSEKQLRRLVNEYVDYFNEDRPHQGINQRIPVKLESSRPREGEIVARPVLGGLHRAYHHETKQVVLAAFVVRNVIHLISRTNQNETTQPTAGPGCWNPHWLCC
jgi:putative transposase